MVCAFIASASRQENVDEGLLAEQPDQLKDRNKPAQFSDQMSMVGERETDLATDSTN